MESFETRENHLLDNRNRMQMILAERHDEDLIGFINQHAKDFGDYIDNHPELLNKFDTNPDEVLGELEKIVYH